MRKGLKCEDRKKRRKQESEWIENKQISMADRATERKRKMKRENSEGKEVERA